MDRLQKKRAKQTEAYRARNKRSVLLIILWIIASLVFGFTVFPVVGAIGLLLWPVVVLVSLIRSHILLKAIVSQLEETSPETEPNPQTAMRQRQQDTVPNQQNLSHPVVNAVASYTIGKAVTERLKQSPLAKNPYTEKYKAKQRELDQVLGQQVPLTKHTCYTCAHWCGQRKIVKQPRDRSYVQLPRNVPPARCSKQFRTVGLMSSSCRDWMPAE